MPTRNAQPDHARPDHARKVALRLLRTRPRSRAELRRRLTDRGFEDRTIDALLADLEQLGLIDDASFARELVESQLRRGPAGEPLLRAKLAKRGIAPDLAAETIAQSLENHDPRPEIAAFVSRCIERAPPDTPTERLARRLLSRLARRGIDAELARNLVRQAIQERSSDAAASDHPPEDA